MTWKTTNRYCHYRIRAWRRSHKRDKEFVKLFISSDFVELSSLIIVIVKILSTVKYWMSHNVCKIVCFANISAQTYGKILVFYLKSCSVKSSTKTIKVYPYWLLWMVSFITEMEKCSIFVRSPLCKILFIRNPPRTKPIRDLSVCPGEELFQVS